MEQTLAGGRGGTLTRRTGGAARRSPAGLVRAVVVDEAELMHFAIRALLADTPGVLVVAAARSIGAGEQLVRRVRPDLLICDTDIAGESGIGLCRWVRQVSPLTRVAILTGRDEPLLAQSALAAGAHGYLLRDSAPEDLMAYLEEAAAGLQVLDQRLGRARGHDHRTDPGDEFGLSRREREVLAEMVAGLPNQGIAERLGISRDTVKSHVKAIFRKLGARDRAHAVALALGTAAVPGQFLRPVSLIPAPRRSPGR
ncbi:MAG TPA: response regulator transcription factor [Streptosporangiaceae bacterium]|nr:response regulator transcription factor [Streptosporangiaceae bacterium]